MPARVTSEPPAEDDGSAGSGVVEDTPSSYESPDAEWFDQYIREYRPRLLAYVRTLTKDSSTAEDVVQESLLRALRRMHRMPDEPVTIRWLWTVARNEAFDRMKKASRQGEVLYGLMPDREKAANPDWATCVTAGAVLADLSPRMVEAFLLCRLAAYTSAEVSEMTGTPAATVRWLVSRAVSALRQAIDGLDVNRGS
jgi:RNA polymerase sigma-70 factor (ECF subfamily)